MIHWNKAFDRVSFSFLISMLKGTQVPPSTAELVCCTLKNSYANVFIDGVNGSQWSTGNGALQGGILSPLLFNADINVVADRISELDTSYVLGTTIVTWTILCYWLRQESGLTTLNQRFI